MPSEQPRFAFLNGAQLALLATAEYRTAIQLYVDCLSVLHDAIEQVRVFGWERLPPRFLSTALRGMVIERSRASLGADARWGWLYDNIDTNLRSAENLTTDADRYAPVQEPVTWSTELITRDARLAAFAGEILKQYVIIRFIRAGQLHWSEARD